MLKALKKRFGISAPRVAVRAHIPWYLRGLGILVLVALSLALAWGTYDAGRKFAGFDQGEASQELDRLTQLSTRLQAENEAARKQLAQIERQLQIDQTAHGDLVKQVKLLEDENNLLKEDLAFFQSLMSAGGKTGSGIAAHRFKLRREAAEGEYHYSLLLVQGGQRPKDFQGRLEFTVNLRQNGKKVAMSLTELLNALGSTDKPAAPHGVSFKFYQRVEGRLRVAPGTVVENLQLRLFELDKTEAVLTQTAEPT